MLIDLRERIAFRRPVPQQGIRKTRRGAFQAACLGVVQQPYAVQRRATKGSDSKPITGVFQQQLGTGRKESFPKRLTFLANST